MNMHLLLLTIYKMKIPVRNLPKYTAHLTSIHPLSLGLHISQACQGKIYVRHSKLQTATTWQH